MGICERCGLPKDICICQEITKEQVRLRIFTTERRYGKTITIIEGFDDSTDLKNLSKKLKSICACGGTIKGNAIELQGNHKSKLKQILRELGFQLEE